MKILRASQIEPEILKDKAKREVAQTMDKVAPIIDRVKKDGDKALIYYTKKFDKVQLKEKELRISDEELKNAYSSIRKEELEAIRFAIENVRAFHEAQRPHTLSLEKLPGVRLAQVFRPLGRVGAYVPGGRASYPSSVVMTVVPAKVAGVKSVIVCSPPNREGSINSAVLVAAAEAGAEASFKVGGAQAIAAMAYGTETVPKVDKIVGPGNVYVAAAKALVNRDVAIDFLAGPSEILVLADDSARPQNVATDLLAQAEHDPQASAVLITTSENLARKVATLVQRQWKTFPRKEIMERVIRENLWIITAVNLEEALELVNNLAPEHLEVMVKEPSELLEGVENAGAIFLGAYSPVAIGDYVAGSNHVLPTGGMAKSFSGLSLRDFIKSIDVVNCSKNGLEKLRVAAETLAKMEGLEAHRRSVEERFRK